WGLSGTSDLDPLIDSPRNERNHATENEESMTWSRPAIRRAAPIPAALLATPALSASSIQTRTFSPLTATIADIHAAVDSGAPRLCPPRRRGAPHGPPSRDPPGSCHKRGLENPAWTDYPPAHCRRDVRSGAWTRPMRGPRTAGDAARARRGGSRRSPSCASCPRRDRSREAWAGYRAPPCRGGEGAGSARAG